MTNNNTCCINWTHATLSPPKFWVVQFFLVWLIKTNQTCLVCFFSYFFSPYFFQRNDLRIEVCHSKTCETVKLKKYSSCQHRQKIHHQFYVILYNAVMLYFLMPWPNFPRKDWHYQVSLLPHMFSIFFVFVFGFCLVSASRLRWLGSWWRLCKVWRPGAVRTRQLQTLEGWSGNLARGNRGGVTDCFPFRVTKFWARVIWIGLGRGETGDRGMLVFFVGLWKWKWGRGW